MTLEQAGTLYLKEKETMKKLEEDQKVFDTCVFNPIDGVCNITQELAMDIRQHLLDYYLMLAKNMRIEIH